MLRFSELRVSTDLQVGKEKLEDMKEALEAIKSGNDNKFVRNSLQFTFTHYAEFILKICEHICAKNGKFKKDMSGSDKIEACCELKFIPKDLEENFKEVIKLRNRIVHSYWVPSYEDVLECCVTKFDLFILFYNNTCELISKTSQMKLF